MKQYSDMAAALRNTPANALREAGYLDRAADMLDHFAKMPTAERCAQIIREWHPDEEAAGCEATWADCKHALLSAVTNLVTPHQHGAGNGGEA